MRRYISLILLLLVACQSNIETPTFTPDAATIPSTAPAIIPTTMPKIVPTPSPYEQYTIQHLRDRNYGEGQIEIVEVLQTTETFTRYLIRYPSDGLTIYGFANVPNGNGLYPIIVAIHGAVAPDTFLNPDFQTDAFDLMSQMGYIVFHPYLRNYPPSDDGDNYFRVGMTIDVLNLIALAKQGNEPAEIFSTANPDQIGLWGYSMGGEIALRILTVSKGIKAAVLYSSLSGDVGLNAQLLLRLSSEPIYQIEMSTPLDELEQMSPANFYRYVTSPIQLYHGGVDTVVPFTFAQETCTALQDAGVNVNCKYFPNEDHSFRSRVSDEFYGSMFDFYKKYLSP